MRKKKSAREVNGAPLSREQLLGADDITFEDFAVPEWGGNVRIKVMTTAEVRAWRKACEAAANERDSELLLCFSLVDDDGERLLTEQDAAALSSKGGGTVERVAVRAMLVNKLYFGALDDSVKNSEPGRSGNSSTA